MLPDMVIMVSEKLIKPPDMNIMMPEKLMMMPAVVMIMPFMCDVWAWGAYERGEKIIKRVCFLIEIVRNKLSHIGKFYLW